MSSDLERVPIGEISPRDAGLIKRRRMLKYILITPARNEARFIGATITSMLAQTVQPIKWVIVSDGSTDGMDAIVRAYADEQQWIELVRMPERQERHFAGKVHAFNAGYARARSLDHDVVGNLDADTTFVPEHFEFLMKKFGEDPRLGVAGSSYREGPEEYNYHFSNIENVWGGCQLFRRECFEEIGGYLPLKAGCIDDIAVISARMMGWKTRTFTERVCVHHRKMGTAEQSEVLAKFKWGIKDYSVGNHPVWELFRTLYQMTRRPFFIGGLALASGYAWSLIRRVEVPVSHDFVVFLRREQMTRLRRFFATAVLLRR